MITVANPIYDVIFKYLMEDERIARTILSALLKMDIIHVEMRPQEYIDENRSTLATLRIDFAATVREKNGDETLLVIELQKTGVETETLRFRRYLAVQYENPKNMTEESKGRLALPMIAVYILGHRVGDIEEPVLYYRHKAFNYDEQPVTNGLPNPFLESLTHDSVIVQIPLLRGRVHNRVEQLLSIFDQSQKSQESDKILRIDDTQYEGDEDMERIYNRLLRAAADADLRHAMNVEEEIFTLIQNRDNDILYRDHEIAEQKAQLKEQSSKIEEQSSKIEEQSSKIEEQSSKIEEQSSKIEEQSSKIEEQSSKIEEQSTKIEEQSSKIEEQSSKIEEQQEQLRMSVRLLCQAGLSPEIIAERLNMNVEQVKQFL